jgi:hypothetical protein
MTCPTGYTAQPFTIKEKSQTINVFACVAG